MECVRMSHIFYTCGSPLIRDRLENLIKSDEMHSSLTSVYDNLCIYSKSMLSRSIDLIALTSTTHSDTLDGEHLMH